MRELTAELGMQVRIPNLEDMSFEPFSTFEEERLIDGLLSGGTLLDRQIAYTRALPSS